jgi:hypothetical protein
MDETANHAGQCLNLADARASVLATNEHFFEGGADAVQGLRSTECLRPHGPLCGCSQPWACPPLGRSASLHCWMPAMAAG